MGRGVILVWIALSILGIGSCAADLPGLRSGSQPSLLGTQSCIDSGCFAVCPAIDCVRGFIGSHGNSCYEEPNRACTLRQRNLRAKQPAFPKLRGPRRQTPAVLQLRGMRTDGSSTDRQVIAGSKILIEGEVQPAVVLIDGTSCTAVEPISPERLELFKGSTDKSSVLPINKEGTQPLDFANAEVTLLDENEILIPAFCNAHAHLAMAFVRGIAGQDSFNGNVVEDLFFLLETKLTEEDVRAFVRMGCWESILHGVGSVWDHYYYANSIAQAMVDTGLSGVVAPTLQDLSGPGLALPGCDSEASLQTTLDIHNNPDFQERGIVAALGPHATDTVSAELWREISKTAEDYDLPIHSHVAQSIEEYQRMQERHDSTPMQFLKNCGVLDCEANMLMVHSMYVTGEDFSLLDRDRHVLGLTPASAIQFGFPCDYQQWFASGQRIALGTDAACSNDSMDVQQELRLLAGGSIFGVTATREYQNFKSSGDSGLAQIVQDQRQKLLTASKPFNDPLELLSTIWSNPGQMHTGHRTGSIETGALANVLVLDENHPNLWPNYDPLRSIAFANIAPSIRGMMIAGKWKGEKGRFQDSILSSKEYQEHREEASERFQSLLKRCGLT